MRQLFLMTFLILAVSCSSSDMPKDASSVSGLSEVSMNFDLDTLTPFLSRVSGLVDSGFGEPEITELMAEVSSMAVDAEKQRTYSVIHAGRSTPLEVRVFMDDVDAPDVAFFTSPTLAEAIGQEMMKFAEELGI